MFREQSIELSSQVHGSVLAVDVNTLTAKKKVTIGLHYRPLGAGIQMVGHAIYNTIVAPPTENSKINHGSLVSLKQVYMHTKHGVSIYHKNRNYSEFLICY